MSEQFDERLHFKVGFLKRCAEAGFSLEETEKLAHDLNEQLEKQSILSALKKPYDAAWDAAKDVAGTVGNVGIAASLLAPPAIGWGLGRGYTYLTDVDNDDVDEIKKKELLEEYQRQIRKIKQLNKAYRRS